MTINWARTHDALRELLDILSCSQCKKNLHDPEQFLGCGHFLCFNCSVTNVDNTCIQCECNAADNKDYIKDKTIQKIIEACCSIAEEVGYRKEVNNVDIKCGDSESHKSIYLKNFESENINLNVKSKSFKKSKKRKKLVNRRNDKNAKKVKLEESTAPLKRIPKNINKRNDKGETKLHMECRKKKVLPDPNYVKSLLDAGADPNIPCFAFWTPLQECADFGYFEIVELLLNANANVNQKGYKGRTALHEACKNDNLEMIKLLLNHGANKNVLDDENNLPVFYCQSEEAKALLQTIEEFGVQYNDIKEISIANSKDINENNSKRTTLNRNSLSPRHITEETFSNFESDNQSSKEITITYEKINNSNSILTDSQKTNNNISNTFQKNVKINAKNNMNCVSSEKSKENLKFVNCSFIDIENNYNCSQDSIDSISNIDNTNISVIYENSVHIEDNVIHDSEEIIDVIN